MAGINTNVTLLSSQNNKKTKINIALKLHWQFAHPSPDKLLKLITSVRDPRQKN